MEKFYTVFGPTCNHHNDGKLQPWQVTHVDCWWCLKSKSVTQANRCYVPVRVQDRIDGSFRTANETEDAMTRKFGYFHTWQCALAYSQVHFPNICYKVHEHAHRHGFVGLLAPATDPRFVTSKFNPYVAKESSMFEKQLIPSSITGVFMRRVPEHEQCTNKFKDSNIVMENASHTDTVAKEFPQCVVDSEQLLHSLNSTQEPSVLHKNTIKRKTTKQPKHRKKKKVDPTKHVPLKNSSLKATSSALKLTDFFGADVIS